MKRSLIVTMSLAVGVLSLALTGLAQAQDVTAEGRAQQRLDRIEQYKLLAVDRLSQPEQVRIASVCEAAQIRVEQVGANLSLVTENRQLIYGSLADKLALVSDRIELSGIDTSQLNTYISQMQLDAQAIVSSLTEQRQVVGDISAMDCEQDVDGFQAALTVARSARSDLKISAQNLESYVVDTIQPELLTLKQQINSTEEQ